MLSRIGKHLSYTNLALTLALVFAITGGAYAAGKYVITSTKQISPKVLKSLQGKPGASGQAGAVGAPGSAGPAGATGAKGENGAPGKAGEPGKEGKEGPVGKNGKEGGEGPVGPAGPKGSPWVAGGTLPSGSTETGVWAFQGMPNNLDELNLAYVASTSISFTIPLAESLTASEKEAESNHVHFIKAGGQGEGKFEAGVEGKDGFNTGCPTTSEVSKPESEPGNLCVFERFAENVSGIEVANAETSNSGAGKVGAVLDIKGTEDKGLSVEGTWAVTAK